MEKTKSDFELLFAKLPSGQIGVQIFDNVEGCPRFMAGLHDEAIIQLLDLICGGLPSGVALVFPAYTNADYQAWATTGELPPGTISPPARKA